MCFFQSTDPKKKFRFAGNNLANIKDKVCASQYKIFSNIKIKDKN